MDKEIITKELTRFNVTDTAIAQLSKDCMHLTIEKDGAEVIHKNRMTVKGLRVSVEKTRKSLKEDALEWGRIVDGEAKRIFNLLQPIEDHLSDEEQRFEEEKARVRAEAAAKEAARVKVLVDKLYSLGCRFDGTAWTFNDVPVTSQIQLIGMPEEQFAGITKAIQTALDEEKAAKAAEQERIAKVAAEQEKERIRLAEEAKRIKEEQDRIAAEQAKERERLAAESKAIQDEKDRLARDARAAEDAKRAEEEAKQRAEEMERVKKAAIEEGARIAEKKAQEEKEFRAKMEEKARVAAERKAARQPDRVKLASFLDRFFGHIAGLDLKTDEGMAAGNEIFTIIQTAEHDCREIVEKL